MKALGVDGKLVADQLGHSLDVNAKRLHAVASRKQAGGVNQLEKSLLSELNRAKIEHRVEAGVRQVFEKLERETGVEPATSSLGRRLSIDNKDDSVFVGLFLAIEFTRFSF